MRMFIHNGWKDNTDEGCSLYLEFLLYSPYEFLALGLGLWMNGVMLLGIQYNRSLVMEHDSSNISLAVAGFELVFSWDRTAKWIP